MDKGLLEIYEQMCDDTPHRVPFWNGTWTPTEKVVKKLRDKYLNDVPSSPLNGHYSMQLPESPTWDTFISNMSDYQSVNHGKKLQLAEGLPPLETAVRALYDLCVEEEARLKLALNLPGGETCITKVPAYPTKWAVEYKGVLLTWDHVISMWSMLTILDKVPDIATKPLVVLDLGSGWGRMGYILKKLNPSICYIACDLPESLVVSSSYLPKTLPNEKIYHYLENKKIEKFSSEKLLDDGGIRFICPHDLLRFEKIQSIF